MLPAHRNSGTRGPGPLGETQDQRLLGGTRDLISGTSDPGPQNFQVGPGTWDLKWDVNQ